MHLDPGAVKASKTHNSWTDSEKVIPRTQRERKTGWEGLGGEGYRHKRDPSLEQTCLALAKDPDTSKKGMMCEPWITGDRTLRTGLYWHSYYSLTLCISHTPSGESVSNNLLRGKHHLKWHSRQNVCSKVILNTPTQQQDFCQLPLPQWQQGSSLWCLCTSQRCSASHQWSLEREDDKTQDWTIAVTLNPAAFPLKEFNVIVHKYFHNSSASQWKITVLPENGGS